MTSAFLSNNIATDEPLSQMTTDEQNSTCPGIFRCDCSTQVASYYGYIAVGIAVIFFGSNFVPAKKFKTGDGMFFQWVLCIAIWMMGAIIYAVLDFPKFYPWAMLGGLLWETGNITVVPILKTIGLGLGMLIWSTTNLVAGWASGKFGLFGLNVETVANPTLNYIGVALSIVRAGVFLFIETSDVSETAKEQEQRGFDYVIFNTQNRQVREYIPLEEQNESAVNYASDSGLARSTSGEIEEPMFYEKFSPLGKRIFGISLALAAGVFYGFSFDPAIYVIDHPDSFPGAPSFGMCYVFPFYTGTIITSTVYFIIYCIVMKNKPKIYAEAILPGMASGMMWAVAHISWFLANSALAQAVTFPILSAGPPLIASLWGVFLFKEIQGKKNFILLAIGSAMTIAGAVCAGASF